MIAPAQRSDAATRPVASFSSSNHGLWLEAARIRQEWLEHGLSTEPADRPPAERGLAGIYARIGRRCPEFVWVDSPYKALPIVDGLPTLDALYQRIRDPRPLGRPPLASDLAASAAALRGRLSDGVVHADPELTSMRQGKKKQPWPELPPRDALERGQPLGVVLHRAVRVALHRSLATGFSLRVRAVLTRTGEVPACWYGQQDAFWVGYYDALRRIGLAVYGLDDLDHLGEWAALVRSCGWWWPGEDVCVLVDRPGVVHTEPVPGAWHDEVRLRAVEFRDGWRPTVSTLSP
jgi:hypothetical protein